MTRVPRQPPPLERVVQQHMCTLLRSIGGRVYVLGGRRKKASKDYTTHQSPGLPDLFAFLPPPTSPVQPALGAGSGVGVWIEVKRPGGRRNPEQVTFGENCACVGQSYVWGDVDALLDWLVRGGWLKREQIGAHRGGGQC